MRKRLKLRKKLVKLCESAKIRDLEKVAKEQEKDVEARAA